MRTTYTSKKSKKILVFIPILLAITFVVAAWLYIQSRNTSDNGSATTETSDTPRVATEKERATEKQTNNASKQNFIENSQEQSTGSVQPTQDADSVDLRLNQVDNAVIASTKLYRFPEGTCTLSATNGSLTKTYTAPILYQPEYSICEGFSIPVSDLGKGMWAITLSAKTSASIAINKSDTIEVR